MVFVFRVTLRVIVHDPVTFQSSFYCEFNSIVGTPCNMMTGYCDVFMRCRGVDPDTPLVNLKRCLKSGECFQAVKDFASVGLTLSYFRYSHKIAICLVQP